MAPWTGADAPRHTKKADTPRLKRIWARAANGALKDYADEGKAVRIANAAVKKARKAGA